MAGRCEDCGIEAANVRLAESGPHTGSSLCPDCRDSRTEILELIAEAYRKPFLCVKCGQRHKAWQVECAEEAEMTKCGACGHDKELQTCWECKGSGKSECDGDIADCEICNGRGGWNACTNAGCRDYDRRLLTDVPPKEED